MTRETFVSHVQTHPQMRLCSKSNETTYYVRNFRNDLFEIPVDEVENHPWEHLEMMLLGKRGVKTIESMSRIVGYYALLRNWNKSKIAELKDRHRGNYTVPEQAILV